MCLSIVSIQDRRLIGSTATATMGHKCRLSPLYFPENVRKSHDFGYVHYLTQNSKEWNGSLAVWVNFIGLLEAWNKFWNTLIFIK